MTVPRRLRQYILGLIGLAGISLAACQAPAVKHYPYLIKVRIQDCPQSTGILYRPSNTGGDRLDSAEIEQGQLVFKGKVDHPGVYEVSCLCPSLKRFINTEIYLPADSVQVAIDTKQNLLPAIYQKPGIGTYDVGSYLRNSRVFSTARQQREVASFLRTRDSLWNKYFLDKDAMAAKMNAAIGAGNKPEIDRWADSTRRVQESFPSYLVAASEQFIKRHPHSEINLFAMLDAGEVRVARQRLLPYYQAMPDSVRTSYFGQVLAKRYGT